MRNKIGIIALTLAMNACGLLAANHVFASGGGGEKAVICLGALIANALALFGHPVTTQSDPQKDKSS